MKFNEFKNTITEEYNKVFPNSRIDVSLFKAVGRSITIRCYLAKDNTEVSHNIWENDMFKFLLDIRLPDKFEDDDELPEEMTIEALSRSITLKTNDPIYYCSYRKIAFRRTTGNADKICNTFKKFIDNVHKAVKEEINNNNIHKSYIDIITDKIK